MTITREFWQDFSMNKSASIISIDYYIIILILSGSAKQYMPYRHVQIVVRAVITSASFTDCTGHGNLTVLKIRL